MAFSGDPSMRRSDLLEVVSVLDVDTVLDRAVDIGVERTGAGAAVLALLDGGSYAGRHQAHASGSRADGDPLLLVRGIGHGAADAVRDRLGSSGLRGGPGERIEQDLVRLRDPASGREVLRIPVVVGGALFADLLLLDPPEGTFDDHAVESIAVLGRVIGVAVRNAVSYTLNERRREALELEAVVDQSVQPPFHLDEPMVHIAAGARQIVGARTAAVVMANEEQVHVAALAGRADEALPVLLERTSDHLRTAQADGRDFTVRTQESVVWGIPFRPEHAVTGVVVLVFQRGRGRRTPGDEELMAAFVRHGSLVLDHAVLQQERQHAVLAADRDRIARDLHDIVIQRLYAAALKLRAGTARDSAPDGPVSEAIREIGDSIRDIRGTVFELERGRSASVRSDALALAREYESALGFVPVVRSWGPVDALVDDQLGDQVTVVLRELLSNCARHAAAGRCEIDLSAQSGWLTLQVTDDGRGMPEGDGPRSGLRNLATRAADRGGELVVEPAEPRGTRIRWRVPLPQEASSPGASEPGGGSAAATGRDGSDQSHSEASVSSTQQRPATSR